MRKVLVALGVIIALVGFTFWWTNGAHRGWTKTSVAVEKIDEITGIPYREYEKKLIAGVEIPAASAALGGVFVFLGWWAGRKK